MIRYPRLLNPGTADRILAMELASWIDSHGYLDPFYKAGQKFIAKGTYISDRATKLFLNAVNRYYKSYAKDQQISVSYLNVPTRKLAATKLREQFEMDSGIYKGNRGKRSRNCVDEHGNIERDKWIPAHAVRFNKDGGVSILR